MLLPAPEDATALRVVVAVGAGAEGLVGAGVPLAGTVVGRAFETGESARALSFREWAVPTSGGAPDHELGPVLVLPLLGSQRVHGVLTVARRAGRPGFSAEDADMARGFANHAALAIELAEARAEQHSLAMLDERERIAADLHDHVIQRLFAAGLSLQSIAMSVDGGRAADRLSATIQDLDDTISQIRTTIFQLQHVSGKAGRTVRGRILDVITDVGPALGRQPSLRFDGPLEHAAAEDIVDDLLAVLREALTNVARHASARSVTVEVSASATQLVLQVQDDGVGITSGRSSGLTNMLRRAERRGGNLVVQP